MEDRRVVMEKEQTNNIVRGAIILTIAGLLSKVLSATYRIPLQNLTGDLGFYIYQQVYPFLGAVIILSLYGFPAAISKLTTETIQERRPLTFLHFYFPIFIILLLLNSVFFLIIYFGAPHIANWIGDVQLEKSFQMAAFLFLLIPFLALLRGAFQGLGQMKQTAYSQVIEQVIRVAIIVTIAYFIFLKKVDIYKISEAGVYAGLLGMTVAIILLAVFFFHSKEVVLIRERM